MFTFNVVSSGYEEAKHDSHHMTLINNSAT